MKRLEAHDGVTVRVHAKSTAYQSPQYPLQHQDPLALLRLGAPANAEI